jgi:hypothetical protein
MSDPRRGRAPGFEASRVWHYTRGYSLGAPSTYARVWMLDRVKRLKLDSPAYSFRSIGGFPKRFPPGLGDQSHSTQVQRGVTCQAVPPVGVIFVTEYSETENSNF